MIYLVNLNEKRILENAGDRIPIGLLSIASRFQQEGQTVKLYDLNHISISHFLSSFYRDKPEIMGISVYTSPIAREARGLARILMGKTKLVAGGYHATAMPESLNEFDLVIQGEGEESLELMKLSRGIKKTKNTDLNVMPSLDYSFLNMNNYKMMQSGRRTGTLITSRGCPYSCAFCFNLNKKVRFEPIEKVLEQAENLKEYGFESLYFLDDVFTLKRDRMKKILSKINLPYRITTRADLLDEDKIRFLADNGCEWLSMGIESGNNEILEKSNKQMTRNDNEEAIYLAGKYGINVKGFFIIGLPGETEETAKDTIEFARDLKTIGLTQADFYFLAPFPGTPIWQQASEFGIEITDRDYTKYLEAGKNARCYVNTEHLSAHRIEEIVRGAKEEWN